MPTIQSLEKKIQELESRIRQLEESDEYSNSLYTLAKDLVAKHHQSSIIFLQKKLLIDHPRATQIHLRLEREGLLK